jgi:hypothetical protein
MWLALKVVLLTCSASTCEHSWSIELDPLKQEKSWIHSNRRNRLGQKIVECLVHTHTNLKLEQRLEMYETRLLTWDIEMTVEDPVSDDNDDPPHRVSDSESESESDQDSDYFFVYFFLTTTTVPPTESLTPSPSLNPSKTLTNFLFNLTWHTGYPFLYFYIFVLVVHIRGRPTWCFQNTTTVSDTHHTFH